MQPLAGTCGHCGAPVHYQAMGPSLALWVHDEPSQECDPKLTARQYVIREED